MNIAILGSSKMALEHAHSILDETSIARVVVYTEEAEIGFPEIPYSEEIILTEALTIIPENWYSTIPVGIDQDNPSKTAHSWLIKLLAIRLVSRGARFLLRTRILEIDEDRQEISFRGGGSIGSGVEPYDELYDFR
ncbi:MAG: hypothetical protein EVA35_03650 [Candidatus Poseidoniales archaeon]|nr:MAG: hypothetical protein EVA35_03650 [Candidatus Poseidoniales archaeon]